MPFACSRLSACICACLLAPIAVGAQPVAPPRVKVPAAPTLQPLAPSARPGAPRPQAKPRLQVSAVEMGRLKRLFDAGVANQKAGRPAAALTSFRQALALTAKAKPGTVDLYPLLFNMALCSQQAGDMKQAEAYARRAAVAGPKQPMAPLFLARVMLAGRRAKEARQAAWQALALNPQLAEAYFVLGGSYAMENNLPAAEKEYREAARLNPRNVQAVYNLGYSQARQQHYPAAIETFKRVLELKPDYVPALSFLAVVYQNTKDYPAAIATGNRLIALRPRDVALIFNVGASQQALAETLPRTDPRVRQYEQQAISSYLKALEIQPSYLPARVNVARLYYTIGNYPIAARHFAAAARLAPANGALMGDLALSELGAANAQGTAPAERKERLATAERLYVAAIAKRPAATFYNGLTNVYQQQNRPDMAYKALQSWTAKYPKDANAWMALAMNRSQAGKADEAVAGYEKAIAADPKGSSARLLLAGFHESRKEWEKAIEQYQALKKANPKDVTSYANIGRIYQQQNKDAEAVAEYEAMKKVAPDQQTAYASLAQYYNSRNQLDKALAEFQQMLPLYKQGDVTGIWNVATQLERMGRYDEAAAQFRELCKVHPESLSWKLKVPNLLVRAGKADLAFQEYARLRAAQPTNVEIALAYADDLAQQKRVTEARGQYDAVVALGPTSTQAARALVSIGDGYLAEGNTAEAEKAYQRAADTGQNRTMAFIGLQNVYAKTNTPDKMTDYLEQRLRKAPGEIDTLNRYEERMTPDTQQPRMFAFLKSLVSSGAKPGPVFLRAYAQLLEKHSRPSEAADVYGQLAALDPADYSARANRGRLLASLGADDQAISAYREALRVDKVPVSLQSEAHLKLGNIYAKRNDKVTAKAEYDLALKADPNNPQAQAAIKALDNKK